MVESGSHKGGKGAFRLLYEDSLPLADKIEVIAKKIYRADGVDMSKSVLGSLRDFDSMGFGDLPVCMAKTQYSFSTDVSKRVDSGNRHDSD